MSDNEELNKVLGKETKKVFKISSKFYTKVLLVVVLIVSLLAGGIYIIKKDDSAFKEGDKSSVPYANKSYQSSVSISEEGIMNTSQSAWDLWKEIDKNGGKVSNYLNSPSELKRLMNAEAITQHLDTRSNPDEPIEWGFNDPNADINDSESTKIQGIVKLKRKMADGNTITLRYVDPETLQGYIDSYNSSGSVDSRNEAMKYFTISQSYSNGSSSLTSGTIEDGTAIEIPQEYGGQPVYTYERWSVVGNWNGWLRDQTGGQFTSKGYGVVNGRYVVACTETFGVTGDYIDVYLDRPDGGQFILPCIIGDTKSQNDEGCNMWGHNNGRCIIEFIVSDEWRSGHGNVTEVSEWTHEVVTLEDGTDLRGMSIKKIVHGSSYKTNPNFGKNDSIDSNTTQTHENNDEMAWPTAGRDIILGYKADENETHKGIDIKADEGQFVYACEDGRIENVGESRKAGKFVVINHGNGYVSKYWHNSEVIVQVGDEIKKGEKIAKVGTTGQRSSNEVHLHFQLEYNGDTVDPMTFKYNVEFDDDNESTRTEGIGNNAQSLSSATLNYCAKVVTWNESTRTVQTNDSQAIGSNSTNYNMTLTNINYKDLVKGYTMPFDYLWSLLVVTDNKQFVFDIADLVYNSEIEITVFDNLQTVTNVQENTYTRLIRNDNTANIQIQYGNSEDNTRTYSSTAQWSEESTADYTSTYTYVTKTNTLEVGLTKANVWIVDYEKGYTQQTNEQTEQNSIPIADQNYSSQGYQTTRENVQNRLQSNLDSFKERYSYVTGGLTQPEVTTYHARINNLMTTTRTTVTNTYVAGTPEIREKTDKNSEEPNFVTILLKTENNNALFNIIEISDWLFEILEENPNTSEMVDLTKYLLYKTTSKSYGVEEYDFSAYRPENFQTVNGIYGGTIQEKVWFALKGLGISDEAAAGAMGNIDYESAGFSTTTEESNGEGIGLCQWSFGRKTALISYASSKGLDWKDESVQVEFLITEISGNGPAEGYATYQLVDGTYDGVNYTADSWKNVGEGENYVEDATRAFGAIFERPSQSAFNSSIRERIRRAKEYYNKFKGIEMPQSNLIVQTANKYVGGRYVYGGSSLTNGCDCSHFVWLVLKECGVIPQDASYFPTGSMDSGVQNNWGCTKIGTDPNLAQPGDIITYRPGNIHHTAIYAGNGIIIEAQSSSTGITNNRQITHEPISGIYRPRTVN